MNLTKPQKLIYGMEKFAGGSISIICGSYLCKGNKSIEDLQNAVNRLFCINDALRIRIKETDGNPYQEILDYQEQKFDILNLRSEQELKSYAQNYAKEPIDLYGSLCDAKIIILPDSYGLIIKTHHMIGDAWTLALLGSQFNELLNGNDVESYSYKEYVFGEEKYLNSKRFEKDRSFFLEQFKKCDEATYISEKQTDTFSAERKTFIINKEYTKDIIGYADKNNSSVFTLFMTALGIYFNRTHMNTEKFYIGTAVLNRTGVKEKNTAGMFINTVPVLIELDNEKSFLTNAENVRNNILSTFRHQKYNYSDVLSDIRKEHNFTEKLYDVVLSYQNAKIIGADADFASEWYHSGCQAESLQIHIDDRDSEGIFKIHYDYQTEKFNEKEIENLHSHIMNLLYDGLQNDDKLIYSLNILNDSEQQKLLFDFNDTAVDYPRDKCVHQLFEEQVEKTPDKIAVIACDKTLTYRELNEQANRIAHSLIEKGIGVGDIVAFMLPRKSYLIATMLGILKAGAAYLPIDPDYPQDRIDYMLTDSDAKLYVTKDSITDFPKSNNTANPAINLSSKNQFCCIYTSGSTGQPKGVILTHKNIVNYFLRNTYTDYIANCKAAFSISNIIFDMFINEVFSVLLFGSQLVLANELDINSSQNLANLIVKHKVESIICTPTKFKIYLNDKTFQSAISNVKLLTFGGEVLTEELCNTITSYSNAIIINGYGPTETTIVSSYGQVEKDNITIGKPIANTQIYIVDKFMRPTPIGIIGEICIAGDGVGAGYINRPELTAEKFIDNPFGEGKLYKTGDLAYWREDGNIVYVGRNDFQVKIRGLRIELGEIENAMLSVKGISQAVVVVRKNNEGRQLICAFYTGDVIDAKDIRNHIGKKLPKYMLPHIFTHIDEMPLTSSGKINRKALPEINLYNIDNTVEFIAPQSEKEVALVNAIENTLSIDKVGIMDNFFDLGGDSLKAIELISKLQKSGYNTDTKTIFDSETVKELAEKLTASDTEEDTFEFEGDIPATAAQMRVYTAQSMNADSTTYNVPYAFKVESLDVNKLQTAVNALVARHESLRTHFENKDGHIIQVIDKFANCKVERLQTDDISDFIRPFDLRKSPLMRIGYYDNTIIIDMHHIITDGSSMPTVLSELNELYMGRELTDTPVQYKQFAVKEQYTKEDEEYWLSVYNDEIPVLEINTDFKRGQKQSFNGKVIYDSVDIELHNKILAFCKKQNITPYVFYMGAFNILLSKFSGNEDVVVGMPISGRKSKFLKTIGMFVNTIALRNKPVGTKTVADFLNEVKENSIAAINHQSYPYGELVKKLNIHTTNRNPLFDVMFAYQSEEMTGVVFGDKKAELLPIPIATSKYDFTFNIMPRANDVVIMAEYCIDLYKEQTLQRFICGYKQLLEQLLNEKQNLSNLSAILPKEQQKLLYDFNDTAVDYPKDKCVHTLFEEQVKRTPDKVAVVACDKTFTYRELNEEANRIAHSLIEKGVGVGDIVSFALPRKSYLIATVLGILKTGAAYLPIDPDCPQDRIDYMLTDSNAKYFITENNITELLGSDNTNNPNVLIASDDLCYCIYTSGSTGNPKGTLLAHANVVNYVNNNNNNNVVHKIIKSDYKRIVSVTTVGFDIFVTESLLPLTNGLEVILANEEQAKFQEKLSELLEKHSADVLQTTPTKMKSLIANESKLYYLKGLKAIILGGEALESSLVEELNQITDAKIFNIYGPTEATVWVTNTRIRKIKYLFEYFEEQVNMVPNRIAVKFKNKSLTYLQLNELVNKYCAKLQSLGIKKNDVVAIHLNRSYELIVFQLAVLKAGAVFLPVDKRYPKNRIEYMCKDCNVAVLITDESYKIEGTKTFYLSEFKSINSQQTVETVFNDNVCYIIYTSGSTGNPKGCMLKSTSLVNFCKNNNTLKTLKKNENNIFACVNSVSFDYFIAESLLPLLNGYTTVILDDEESTNQKLFLEITEKNNINVLMTTPTRLKIFFDDKNNFDILKQLDCICTSGEPLPHELLSMIYSKSPKAQVYNPLGPSECTVWNIGGELSKQNGLDLHIGKPIANTQIYIVDKYMQPTPIGVTGELCVAGDGVGAGYLNRPELTAEKFIDNPFGEGKLYKTGDLAYWREDGNIVYVGRNDFQVKIRGLRIELGEIENAMLSVRGIHQAVVVVRKNNEGRQLICAFYAGDEIDAKEIRNHIGKKLPKYMLPHIFTHLEEMPLTSSGKINRKALPEIDLENITNDTEYVAPETQMQKELCRLIEVVLGVSPVGINDDFFDLGGDSLKAIEFVSKAHNEGIYFNLQNVFDYPTVNLLCEFLTTNDIVHNQYNLDDFKDIHSLLKNNFKCDFVPEKNVVGDILLTGATGFLGIHILAQFIENESGKIYCIVRGKSNEDSISRLEKQLKYYFNDKYLDLLNKRIIVLCGDIQKENFGINNIPKVDMVVNAAASVKHYGSYKYFYDINVGGTINALKVAKAFKAKFIQISTLSVSGNSMADIFDGYISDSIKTFSERNLYIEQPLDNVYIISKFEAEVAVYNEILNGLKANVIRVGNLTNRSSDLKFQPNYKSNAFLSRVKAVIDMGMIPDYLFDLYSEFSPVDDTANAIIKIAQHFNDQNIVFHVNNHNNLYFDRFIELANEIGIPMQVLDGDEFSKNLSELASNPKTQYIYEALINDLDKDGKLVYDSNIHIENDLTVEYLKKIGFDWSKIDYNYLKAYVEYFNRLGYLEV